MNKPRENLVLGGVEIIIRDFSYEDIIPYQYLENLFDCDKNDMSFGLLMGFAKEALVEYGYVLKPIINEGYKVLHPREIADYVTRKNLVSSLNKLEKGCKILHYADKKQLNKAEKERLEKLEKFILELHHDNENKILTIQYQLNEARAKELAELTK